MSELSTNIQTLSTEVDAAYEKLNIAETEHEVKLIELETQNSDFWNNPSDAQSKMKQLAGLSSRIEPWLSLKAGITEISDLINLDDSALLEEIQTQYVQLKEKYEKLKTQLYFSGPYDSHSVLLSIHAGAGGTDAQDWAQMLLRMYTRLAEQEGQKAQLLDQSVGEEAGIKSATLEIDIPFAYGKLKGEHGVHRLVRLSPFNSDNLRQTSFAKVDIMPKIDKPDELLIDENDIKIDVYRAGGHGGQSVNTTDSAVRATHVPSGITVSIQNERSQLQNKETALTILRSRLAQLQIEQHKERLDEIKGPNQSAEWGNQIRSYVLHPYKQVKDLRTRYETSDPQAVLDGNLEGFITSYLEFNMGSQA